MILTIASIINLMLLGGIIVVLKKGFEENIKGLESLDDRLKKIENKMDKE